MKRPTKRAVIFRRFLAAIPTFSLVICAGIAGIYAHQTAPKAFSQAIEQSADAHISRLPQDFNGYDSESVEISDAQFQRVPNLSEDDISDALPVDSPGEVVTAQDSADDSENISEDQPNQQNSPSVEQEQQNARPQTQSQSPAPSRTNSSTSSIQNQNQSSNTQSTKSQSTIRNYTSSAPSLSSGTNRSTSALTRQRSRTIKIMGEEIPYKYSLNNATAAPESGCAIWKGSEKVNDGKFAYFIGHNPGDFHNVMNLKAGDRVTVCDLNKKIRSYTVRYAFVVPQKSTYSDIAHRVEGHGESIVLQTCCGDDVNVRIVVAW